jgi:hypothetical protein
VPYPVSLLSLILSPEFDEAAAQLNPGASGAFVPGVPIAFYGENVAHGSAIPGGNHLLSLETPRRAVAKEAREVRYDRLPADDRRVAAFVIAAFGCEKRPGAKRVVRSPRSDQFANRFFGSQSALPSW